ncbi:MAG: ester cyclase [Proteobacteria bacterium]|nr:ester cyclase [Pseudomonadota bacterium]
MRSKSAIYKKQVDDLLNTLWNDKSLEVIDDYFGGLSVVDSPISTSIGGNAKKEIVKKWFDALPDVSYKTDLIICENNTVISNWTCKGSHLGEFMGAKETGHFIEYKGSSTFKFGEDNQVCYYHAIANITDIMKSKNIELDINKSTNFRDPSKIIGALNYALGIPLTEIEVRVLSLWLRSYRPKDIAIIFSKSHRTVEGQLSHIRTKIGLHRPTEIIEYLKSKDAYIMFDLIYKDTIIKYERPIIK